MAASFSQAKSTFVIPTAQPSDPESVRDNLAHAHAEFERGAVREALRLLRKAAESCDEAGDDLRAVALARAAADLATEVGPTAVPPPPPAPLPPPSSLAPPSAVKTTAGSHAPASAATQATVPPISATVAAAPVVGIGNDATLQQLLESGRAVRVVVKRSARDDSLYIVRRADGHAPSLGAREAVILLTEPDDVFFAPSKTS